MGQMDAIINLKIRKLKFNSGENYWEINDKIEQLRDTSITVKDYLNNGVLNSSGNNDSIRTLMYFQASKGIYDIELKRIKTGTCSNIDKAIEYNIHSFEKELIKM